MAGPQKQQQQQQNGIDMLCDAAGPDLLSSFPELSSGRERERVSPAQSQSAAAGDGQGREEEETGDEVEGMGDGEGEDEADMQKKMATRQQDGSNSPCSAAHQAPWPQDLGNPGATNANAGVRGGGGGGAASSGNLARQSTGKRVKLTRHDGTPSQASTSNHVCHICRRVYERADHLTRHLRSHENARPYQCTRCPKRFNRADLLTRHETTHDRNDSGAVGGRPIIRRSDRAAEACTHCAASKAKCDDSKPCGRCRAKGLMCRAAEKKGIWRVDLDDGAAGAAMSTLSTSEGSNVGPRASELAAIPGSVGFGGGGARIPGHNNSNTHHTPSLHDRLVVMSGEVPSTPVTAQGHRHSRPQAISHPYQNMQATHPQMHQQHTHHDNTLGSDAAYLAGTLGAQPASSIFDYTRFVADNMAANFNPNPMHDFLQDLDFSSTWNLNLDGFTMPQLDVEDIMGPSPGSTGTGAATVAGTGSGSVGGAGNMGAPAADTAPQPGYQSKSKPGSKRHGKATRSKQDQTHSRSKKDLERGHAAFKRSPWLWEPKDEGLHNQKDGIELKEDSIPGKASRALDGGGGAGAQRQHNQRYQSGDMSRLTMSSTARDSLFAMVIDDRRASDGSGGRGGKAPSFPGLDDLNYLLQTYFVQADQKVNSWIHVGSFEADTVMPQLLGAVVSLGAMFISERVVWNFGMAMQEVVRCSLASAFEGSNSYTRNLQCLQAFVLVLDIGQWSGFKRKMEIAESFVQPVLTMLRRAGALTPSPDRSEIVPNMADSPRVLDAKWRCFIQRESYKRLVLHLFFHDVRASIALQKNVLMTFNELGFQLPAARNLWEARTPVEWRDNFLAKKPLRTFTASKGKSHAPVLNSGNLGGGEGVEGGEKGGGQVAVETHRIPRMNEVMYRLDILDEFEEHVDADLCRTALAHGYWGQVAAYRDAVCFYSGASSSSSLRPRVGAGMARSLPGHGASSGDGRSEQRGLWLKIQHDELYRDLNEFGMAIGASFPPSGTGGHYPLPGFGSGGSGSGLPVAAGLGPAASQIHQFHQPPDATSGTGSQSDLTILLELFKMILHVSLDELQRFAGKVGEEEGRRATANLEDRWIRGAGARYALWHAGQVFRAARTMRPASLRGFEAMGVYFAALTLWAWAVLAGGSEGGSADVGEGARYGVGGDEDDEGEGGHEEVEGGLKDAYRLGRNVSPVEKGSFVILDGPETPVTRAFLEHARGVPALEMQGMVLGLGSAQGSLWDEPQAPPSPDDPFAAAGLGPATGTQHNLNNHHPRTGHSSVAAGATGFGSGAGMGMGMNAHMGVNMGTPGLSGLDAGVNASSSYGVGQQTPIVWNPGVVLSIARDIFRDNYPVRSEPLPPLVERLANLLRDLGSGTGGGSTGPAGRASPHPMSPAEDGSDGEMVQDEQAAGKSEHIKEDIDAGACRYTSDDEMKD